MNEVVCALCGLDEQRPGESAEEAKKTIYQSRCSFPNMLCLCGDVAEARLATDSPLFTL